MNILIPSKFECQGLRLTVFKKNDIVEILRESTQELGRLKEQLEPLILFFSSLETTISVDVMKQVDAFLKTIERNVQSGSDPNELSVNLGKASKKVSDQDPGRVWTVTLTNFDQRVLEAALQIQGRFSVISDISSAYVKISNTCIREAINRMELLSKVSESDWERKREEFDIWCLEAVDKIHSISKDTSDHIGETMQNRIKMLERRAIEAAEEAAESQ